MRRKDKKIFTTETPRAQSKTEKYNILTEFTGFTGLKKEQNETLFYPGPEFSHHP
jgi:hypothetical protein